MSAESSGGQRQAGSSPQLAVVSLAPMEAAITGVRNHRFIIYRHIFTVLMSLQCFVGMDSLKFCRIGMKKPQKRLNLGLNPQKLVACARLA